jgi:hypothetical protein
VLDGHAYLQPDCPFRFELTPNQAALMIPTVKLAIGRSPRGLSAIAAIAFVLVAADSVAQTVEAPRCGSGARAPESRGAVFFPQDQIFCAILADPKEARSFVSRLRGTFRSLDHPSGKTTTIASVGVGDSYGLIRWRGPTPSEGVQLDVLGSIFAQFDLGTPSSDLINADYLVGLPITFRRSGFSTRLRVYHQSSHLGDEYLLRSEDGEDVNRQNLSFESVELLASQEWGLLRVYAGGERILRREPQTLPLKLFHGGAEFRTGRAGSFQVVGGMDVKETDLDKWSPAVSGRIGLELARSGSGGSPARLLTLMVEFYQGPSPYGQFFQDDISYVGVGVHLGL